MKTQKILFVLSLFFLIFMGGGCNAMEKNSGVLKGREGIFAVMETSQGEIVLELYYKDTPLTVTNFVGLAEGTLDAAKGKPFYDGLIFHRVISRTNGDAQDFMIQGGDPEGSGRGGPGYRFPDEILDKYKFTKAGLLAMANAGPGTNGSQFFITIVPTTWLNGNHTIFGEVIEGQSVVNKMRMNDKIKSVKIIRQGADAEKFTATQADFDKLLSQVEEKTRAAKEAAAAAQIAEIEKKFPGFEKSSDGIYYKTTSKGNGAKTGKGKNVATHYKGYLIDGTVFDSSEGRSPLEFRTGAGQMIPGFDTMVQDMARGEKRTIVIPPDLAYGDRGYPGVIPPKSYIAFDIELVKN